LRLNLASERLVFFGRIGGTTALCDVTALMTNASGVG
jgi:hypothetical protein